MKGLNRNKQVFYYCLYNGKTEITQDSLPTGEYTVTYKKAELIRGNISSSIGETQIELFGNFNDYEKVIIVDDPNCPINENSVLFIDVTPTYTDNIPNFNYIVNKVAKTLNFVAYAVSKVK